MRHGRKRKYDWELLRKLRADGLTFREIVKKTGVSLGAIQYALRVSK